MYITVVSAKLFDYVGMLFVTKTFCSQIIGYTNSQHVRRSSHRVLVRKPTRPESKHKTSDTNMPVTTVIL